MDQNESEIRSFDNKTNKDIGVIEIISPIWSNFSLPTNIPDIQFETNRLDTFDIETLEKVNR